MTSRNRRLLRLHGTMDAIRNLDGTAIKEIYGPTHEILMPLLLKNKDEIQAIKRDTHQYGLTPRHKLDVYHPPTKLKPLPPIVIFTYGGGLEVGDRILPDTHGLVYANLGAFFARRGFLTVIADYRLSSAGAVYPDASKDIADALEYTVNKLDKLGDTNRIYFFSHSAGALNQSLLLVHPTLLRPDLRRRIKAAIFNGGAFRFESKEVLVRVQAYFGYDGLHITNSPYGLLRSASDTLVASLPPILMIVAEKEPQVIADMTKDFGELLKARNVQVTNYISEGHNHISAVTALSTGDEEGEKWAEYLVSWLKELK